MCKEDVLDLIHKELLSIMNDIHVFCVENDIKYSLCGGSLLGAIRHDGFIPWDDDMDIMLDRNNYEKLISLKHLLPNYIVERELWVYRIRKKEPLIINGFMPTIDIFVMDNSPKNFFVRKFKVFNIKILQGMMKKEKKYKMYSVFGKIAVFTTSMFGKFFTEKFKWKQYEKISRISNGKERVALTCYNDLYHLLNLRYDSKTMDVLIMHKFENLEFMITEKWHQYLTLQYGDYMTLPKEKYRIPEHLKQ